MRKKPNFLDKIETIDVPSFVMYGGMLGFLIPGIFSLCLGSLCESPKNYIWSWPTILSGLACVAIAILIALFNWVYWRMVLRKNKVYVSPILSLGPLLGIMAIFSAAMTAAELSIWITEQFK